MDRQRERSVILSQLFYTLGKVKPPTTSVSANFNVRGLPRVSNPEKQELGGCTSNADAPTE